MSTVREVLDTKGNDVWSVAASRTVHEAITIMVEKNVGALIVSNEHSQLAGIISERDCVRRVMLEKKSATDTPVEVIMTKDVVVAHEDTNTDVCMSLLSGHGIRHLPVMKGRTPVGIVTVGDLMKFTIEEQAMTIEELQSFIFVEEGGEG